MYVDNNMIINEFLEKFNGDGLFEGDRQISFDTYKEIICNKKDLGINLGLK